MKRESLMKIGAELRGETLPLHWFRDHDPTEDDYCYACIKSLAFKALIELGPLDGEPPTDPEAMLGGWIIDWLAGESAPWAGPRDELGCSPTDYCLEEDAAHFAHPDFGGSEESENVSFGRGGSAGSSAISPAWRTPWNMSSSTPQRGGGRDARHTNVSSPER